MIPMDIRDEVLKMDKEDLKALSKLINQRYDMLTQQQAQRFMVGDRVTFNDKTGRPVTGVVTKISGKTIKVDCGPLAKWTVSAGLLTLAK